MSLKLYLGPSGSGKSYQLHKDVLKWAAEDRNRNFLFLVPDQFTMQTQIDLVKESDCGGIMNIDVLSFSRLAHRIFEETGCEDRLVLDDTGKSLVLRKLSSEYRDRLPMLGPNLDKLGYIHEIKSLISEFKQYDISPEGLEELIEFSKNKGILKAKLDDLKVIYEAFNNYICNEFITTEETMSLLTQKLSDSKIIKGAVVILDGFTGFTPVQYRLIQRLLELTKQVIVSITIDINSSPYSIVGEQELFCLSKKTIKKLQLLSQEVNVAQEADVILKTSQRFKNNAELSHLEGNLFRFPYECYPEEVQGLHLYECRNPHEEVRRACIFIKEQVLDKGYEYRDIAVVCGDLSVYADEFSRAAATYELPIYIDRTHSLDLNPFVECIMAALDAVNDNFSYDSMFHLLRSGLLSISNDEIDRLENYVLRCGIRGKRKWSNAFTAMPSGDSALASPEDKLAELDRLNALRERIMYLFDPIMSKKGTAEELISGLYEFIIRSGAQKRLEDMSAGFEASGRPELAREYSQIYRMIIDLLDQIYALLKSERLTLEEFIGLLDSGIAELDVGTIPGGVDRIIVGDIERSRIGQIKILMFLGVNDGNIPKANTKGGIISDFDREFLKGQSLELSPTPREQIYTQRFYLYQNMTKPSESLYISYSNAGMDGKTLRESYLVSTLRKLFPKLETNKDADRLHLEDIFGVRDGAEALSIGLREYAKCELRSLSASQLQALYRFMCEYDESTKLSLKLLEAAFFRYEAGSLSARIVQDLYSKSLNMSVSRLEKFANCEYAHFLQYGMALRPREEFGFERVDLGDMYHSILEQFAQSITARGYTLSNFDDEAADEELRKIVESLGVNYGEAVLHSSFKNEFMLGRILEIMRRTVHTLKKQLQAGSFIEEAVEQRIKESIELPDGNSINFVGKIDRIDLYKKDDKVYVKIIDYKSGNKDIELDSLFYGLSLQQPLYMSAALKQIRRKYPELDAHMGAMFYYHIDDPIISSQEELSEDKIEEEILKSLKVAGVMNSLTEVVNGLDAALIEDRGTSKVIPAAIRTDGTYSKNSKLMEEEELELLTAYADQMVKTTGQKILEGQVLLNPVSYDKWDSCTYCQFKEICMFDERIEGYRKRRPKKLSDEEALEQIRSALESETESIE